MDLILIKKDRMENHNQINAVLITNGITSKENNVGITPYRNHIMVVTIFFHEYLIHVGEPFTKLFTNMVCDLIPNNPHTTILTLLVTRFVTDSENNIH